MTVKTLSVKCPNCDKQVIMNSASLFKPFCSDRCKSIDFGGWASETHVIEGKELTEDDLWSGETQQ